jgi:hypothetical protein
MEAIWKLEEEERLDLAIVPGMIEAELIEHGMVSESSSSFQGGVTCYFKSPAAQVWRRRL